MNSQHAANDGEEDDDLNADLDLLLLTQQRDLPTYWALPMLTNFSRHLVEAQSTEYKFVADRFCQSWKNIGFGVNPPPPPASTTSMQPISTPPQPAPTRPNPAHPSLPRPPPPNQPFGSHLSSGPIQSFLAPPAPLPFQFGSNQVLAPGPTPLMNNPLHSVFPQFSQQPMMMSNANPHQPQPPNVLFSSVNVVGPQQSSMNTGASHPLYSPSMNFFNSQPLPPPTTLPQPLPPTMALPQLRPPAPPHPSPSNHNFTSNRNVNAALARIRRRRVPATVPTYSNQSRPPPPNIMPQIKSIERIQNQRWYKQYAAHQCEFRQKLGKQTQQWLFHGNNSLFQDDNLTLLV